MKTLIKGGRVVDPSQDLNEIRDLLVIDGKIKQIDKNITNDDAVIVDARGKYVVPGLIDMHVHFREPGFEHKETIETGSRAAVAGGFTTVVCMPNTNPVIDSVETIQLIQKKAKSAPCNVLMMGSITQGLAGDTLSPYEQMLAHGIVGITDDGKSVEDTSVMLEALKAARALGLVVGCHCEDPKLMFDRSINMGRLSSEYGLKGIPALTEEIMILRDAFLAEETGAHVHIQHISSKRGVEIVRTAKQSGVNITCEAAPHHFTLTEDAIRSQGTNAKMSPPLRVQEDVEALKQALADGTIDVIATDHAPHTLEDKVADLVKAANGIVGLETSVGLALNELYHTGLLEMNEIVRKMSTEPARILGIDKGSLKVGSEADITIIDTEKSWCVDAAAFQSKGVNTPFQGMQLKGKAVMTMVNGEIVYVEEGCTCV